MGAKAILMVNDDIKETPDNSILKQNPPEIWKKQNN